MNLLAEPDDHGIGRSRGGLSTKIHHLTDGNGLPLVVLIGAGQAGDSPMFPILLSHLRIERAGSVPARTRPDAVLKLALTYRAGALLHAIFLWSRHITL